MERKPLLEVNDLRPAFISPKGRSMQSTASPFRAGEGETLAVVGESGCGKSVTMLSVLRLIPIPPGEIASGQALFRDRDLFKLTENEMEHVRGKEIAMVFQDPMTSLNPVLTIGRQISETLRSPPGHG